ncbi:MAG: hypothetical protein P1P90_05215 [Patescibacteria group bacterium]|nr:hypothetical protein [Patescibacteria group bacterium]
MRNFWTILVAVFALTFTTAAKAELPDPSAGSAAAEHIEKDKILTCEDAAKCAEEALKRTRKSSRWESCIAPKEVRIVNTDGTFSVKTTEGEAKVVNGQCVCPEGFELSKAYRMVSKSEQSDGTILESWVIRGRCMPTNVEPNADVIVEGLNQLRQFVSRVDVRSANTDNAVAIIHRTIGGHTHKIAYNAGQIEQLRADMEDVKAFMRDACSYENLSDEWKKVCQGVDDYQRKLDEHLRNHWVLGAGAAMEIVRFPDNTYVGPALQLSLETPPVAGPMSLAFVGRLGTGRAEDIGTDNSAGWAYKGSFVPSLLWHLDDNERAKLYTGFLAEQLYKPTGDNKDRARRLGGEVAGAYCPMAELGSPASICFGGFLNLAHGTAIFDRQPTEIDPNPENRGEKAITLGGGFTVTGQF